MVGMGEMLGYDFVLRGVVAGVCVGIICSTLGVVLVLRRLSLIGDGLAHVTFFGVALGLYFRSQPVFFSIPVVMASSLGIFRLMERARMYGDAAIGMVSAGGIAGGIILASLGGGLNVDIFSYLFGNILSISSREMWLSVFLSVVVMGVMVYYYRELMSVSFDEEFAKASGINTGRINSIMVLITSVAVVLTIKVVGVMLTSALMVIPAVTAIQAARGFRSTIAAAALVAVSSVIGGLVISFFLNLPSGAVIVLLNIAFFIGVITFNRFRRRANKETA